MIVMFAHAGKIIQDMKVDIEPGTYVVAVSGGVDSMVLLDLLSGKPDLKLIVAHFDHGIRSDSDKDRLLVQKVAKMHGLTFTYDKGNLGPKTSENKARQARYDFLKKVQMAAGAKAIITAHHQDDLLETAIINLLRGTNRRGLSSLKTHPGLIRPLLEVTKKAIIVYAKKRGLSWHEDSTNQDEAYLRNYVRKNIMPRFSQTQRRELVGHISKLGQLNNDIDNIISTQVGDQTSLDRHWFTMLEHRVARDVMAMWLAAHEAEDLNKKQLEILVRAAKTYKPGKSTDVDDRLKLRVLKDELALWAPER